MDYILQVKNLSVSLAGQEILSNINFGINRGDTLAIIGPNGSGKTVLLKTLLGLLSYQGNVNFSPNTKIGYVPQRINLDPYLRITVNDLLKIKQRLLGLGLKSIDEIIKFIPLREDIFDKQLTTISGGELQRVLIIFALLGRPDILLLDEPTANVDAPGEKKIYEALHHFQDHNNITLILVSHDLHIIHQHANQVLCINKEMVCFGETHEMLKPGVLKELYGDKMLYHHIHEKVS